MRCFNHIDGQFLEATSSKRKKSFGKKEKGKIGTAFLGGTKKNFANPSSFFGGSSVSIFIYV
jgi:hypothetical protein